MRDDVIIPSAGAAGLRVDDLPPVIRGGPDFETRIAIMCEYADILEGLRRRGADEPSPFGDPALTLWSVLDLLANEFPREAVMAVASHFLRGHIARLDAQRALAGALPAGSA
ncbi:hypothetical protein [Ancylobacter terrae]|uniref:hypothetical protein n=1 Tax=Ancylobacter sp. sgz301288 TaxID=3342077 RepID=UPI00385B5DB0